MTTRTMNLKGHDHVTASVAVDTGASQPDQLASAKLTLEVSGDRITELRWALNRALGTSPDSPKWLFDLCDLSDVAHGLMPAVPVTRDDRLAKHAQHAQQAAAVTA